MAQLLKVGTVLPNGFRVMKITKSEIHVFDKANGRNMKLTLDAVKSLATQKETSPTK